MATYQFIRIAGFPRGSKTKKKSTLVSVLAEGQRVPAFSRHVSRPSIRINPMDRHFESVDAYRAWIEEKMLAARNPASIKGQLHYRGVRQDAVAIGTVIVSLPSLTVDTSDELWEEFYKRTVFWIKAYLHNKGQSLDYVVEHFDEKYPHLHAWFTPNDEHVNQKLWSFGHVANPKLKEITQFRRDFYNQVGHKFVDALEKEKDQRVKREPSRYIASQNRLPPGTPTEDEPVGSLLGFSVKTQPNKERKVFNALDIEQSPHFLSAVSQLLSNMTRLKKRAGLLSDKELLDRVFAGSGLSQDAIDQLSKLVLESTNKTDETSPAPHQAASAIEAGKAEPAAKTLSQLAKGRKFTPPTR